MAGVYSELRDSAKALEYYEESLQIRKTWLPRDRPDLATSYELVGNVCSNMGDFTKALGYHEQALQIMKKHLPPDHQNALQIRKKIESVKEKLRG
jgi:tetratricopeptide (TPR) repeat protein